MKNCFILLFITFLILSCQRTEIVKTHGIAYLEKREKLIFINKSNKNDVIALFGQPSTKGMTNENLWIYIERTLKRGKMLKLGKNYLQKNNILVLEFDTYGILKKKDFYDKSKMNNIEFTKNETSNEIRKENFIYNFLSSVRQKMQNKKK